MGSNAIHAAAPILARLAAYEPRTPVIDGLEYREGLNAVGIEGGVAGNVIPDACTVTVNYRYAPDRQRGGGRSPTSARSSRTAGSRSSPSTTTAGGALPGLSHPAAAAFIEAVGGTPAAQVRLDRRLPLQRARRARGQLRPRRPAPGAQARRARGDGEDPARARSGCGPG